MKKDVLCTLQVVTSAIPDSGERRQGAALAPSDIERLDYYELDTLRSALLY